MKLLTTLISIAALVTQGFAAPQFITFNDGKLGVNFAGYHAAVGLGGLLGQNGGGGGLFAEAGTPHGQAARAGLGGSMDSNSGASGGLYAGATAGGGVKASAGLAGGVAGGKSAGSGYASAQAGPHYATSGLGGDTSEGGASGFTFSGTKSFGITKGAVESTVVNPEPVQPEHKKVHKEFNFEASNNVDFVPLSEGKTSVEVQKEVQPAVIVKEVYAQPQVIEKRIHKHPKHHHRKAYIGGYIGGEAGNVQPAIQKRIDTGLEASAEAGINANAGHTSTITKQVTFQRNPNFFADIFNIPISTLKAVGNLLGNAAGSTSVSVQKSGSIQAGGYAF